MWARQDGESWGTRTGFVSKLYFTQYVRLMARHIKTYSLTIQKTFCPGANDSSAGKNYHFKPGGYERELVKLGDLQVYCQWEVPFQKIRMRDFISDQTLENCFRHVPPFMEAINHTSDQRITQSPFVSCSNFGKKQLTWKKEEAVG